MSLSSSPALPPPATPTHPAPHHVRRHESGSIGSRSLSKCLSTSPGRGTVSRQSQLRQPPHTPVPVGHTFPEHHGIVEVRTALDVMSLSAKVGQQAPGTNMHGAKFMQALSSRVLGPLQCCPAPALKNTQLVVTMSSLRCKPGKGKASQHGRNIATPQAPGTGRHKATGLVLPKWAYCVAGQEFRIWGQTWTHIYSCH